jgi:hypothetical protein
VIGAPYSFTLQATGGTKPYSWGITGLQGQLPQGFTLTPGGTITGKSFLPEQSTFTLYVVDSGEQSLGQYQEILEGQAAFATLTLTVGLGNSKIDSLLGPLGNQVLVPLLGNLQADLTNTVALVQSGLTELQAEIFCLTDPFACSHF